MNINLFSFAFLIMTIGMLRLLAMNTRTLYVVKAGKVTKLCKGKRRVFGNIPSVINRNGVRIDVSNDLKMLVYGNSMKNYHIYDGQRIYVKTLTEEEKSQIKKYPVLVFHIVDGIEGDAKYKLRKFVCYVNDDNFKDLFELQHDRIKVPEEIFVSQCVSKYRKLEGKCSEKLVLSETYDEEKDRVLYSLHPISTVFGKVEYAM